MSLPEVNIDQVDNALGIMPPGIGDYASVVGTSSAGSENTPNAYASGADVASAFGAGPLVELAAYLIQQTGKPVVCVKSGTTTAGGYTAVDDTYVTGSSTPTADATVEPYDEYDVVVKVIAGGTIGVAGITYQYSLDGGNSFSATTALGTATSITIAAANVKFNLSGGTLVAADYFTCSTTPPTEAVTDITDALAGLKETTLDWDFPVFANPLDATKIAAIDSWHNSIWTTNKLHKKSLGNVRVPLIGESEATYRTSLETALSGSSCYYLGLAGGCAEIQSAISGRYYRRPAAWAIAKRALKLTRPARQDMAELDFGPLGSDIRIRDSKGNRKARIHDEEIDPGLDALRLMTLRTWPGRQTNVFVTRPRIFCPVGSDFAWWQYRTVINEISDAVQRMLEKRCRKPILVSKKTGYIIESEALDIESNVNNAVREKVQGGPDVSSHVFVLNRTDNLLSGATLRGAERIVPLAYPDQIGVTIGFVNPALAQAV